MKKHSITELANRISRALINASQSNPPSPRTWTPSLEQTLHEICCRDSLSSMLVSRVIDPFLIHYHSLALGFFDWASQQPGFTHTTLSYQSILKSLSVSRQFNAIDRLMKQIKTLQIQLDASVYRSVIASHLAAQKPLHAFSVYTDVRSFISEIGADISNSLLASLSAAGNMGHAHQLLDDMISGGVRLSTLGLGVFLWRFCGTAELDKTLRLLYEVKNQDGCVNGSVIALLVVHGLCLSSRAQDAMYMLDVLRKRDCKPDFMAYRVVAEGLRATGNVVHVEQVLKMKRKLGVAPRSTEYRDFIFQLITERLICEARDLGEVIVSGNFPIQGDVLNALIGSVSTQNPCSALMFFNFLIENQSFPTLLTFTNLGRSLCRHGYHDELLQVSKILSAKEYFIDIERYNVMVSFFCKAGKVKEAYQVLQEMKRKGLGPDVSSYNYVMEACCEEDMIRPAKRLWDEMFANGCDPNLKTYNILITKLSDTGQVEEAHRLFCHMLERGVQPDATTYDLIKGEFGAASNLLHDYTSIEHMKRFGEPLLLLLLLRDELLSSSSKPMLILEMIQVIEAPKGIRVPKHCRHLLLSDFFTSTRELDPSDFKTMTNALLYYSYTPTNCRLLAFCVTGFNYQFKCQV